MNPTHRIKALVAIVAAGGILTLASLGGYWLHLSGNTAAAQSVPWEGDPSGTLIICGGGGVPQEVNDCFVQFAGGRAARLVVIPAHDMSSDEAIGVVNFWKRQGIGTTSVLNVGTREDVDPERVSMLLANATAVWLGGGDQKRLANLYVDTEVEEQLRALLNRGGVVGGVSAGAAVMSRVMIAGGKNPTIVQRGFDLLPEAVIDQHFFRRNRAQRLLGVLSHYPDLVGLGVDEHTAVVVQQQGRLWSVIGRSYAMVCLPSSDNRPRLEILKAGDSANIDLLRQEHDSIAASVPVVDELKTSAAGG